MLNGRAKKLSRPYFPSQFTKYSGSFQIKVHVVIDETGKVIYAKAVSGIQSLYPYAESAAKDSKFEPSIVCGKPGKISGVIIYTGEGRWE